jgi:hypothetical protein
MSKRSTRLAVAPVAKPCDGARGDGIEILPVNLWMGAFEADWYEEDTPGRDLTGPAGGGFELSQ